MAEGVRRSFEVTQARLGKTYGDYDCGDDGTLLLLWSVGDCKC